MTVTEQAPAGVTGSAPVVSVPRYIRPRPRTVLGSTSTMWTVWVGVVLTLVIEFVSRAGLVSSLDLVPPTTMARRMFELLMTGSFVTGNLLPTLQRLFESFVLAAVLGFALAYPMWRFRLWRMTLEPYLNVYYAIPVFAIYPILVVLFGTGDAPIVGVSVAFGMVVVTTNTMNGFASVPPTVQKLAVSRQLTGLQSFTKILVPAAIPDIAAGLRLGLVYTTISVLATEFLLGNRGLGYFISRSYYTFEVGDMYAGILLICLMGLILNISVSLILNKIDWRRK
jgi:NitT/TauT family transport system permease protein